MRGTVRSVLALSAMAAAFFQLSPAHAVPQLSISTGGPATIVTDQGPGDLGADPGFVLFSGSVGPFIVNTTTGITNPQIGSPTNPVLDLNSINVNGAGSGVITLMFTQTDFLSAGGTSVFNFATGGTTVGSIQFTTYASDSNDAFGLDILLADSGVLTGPFLFTATADAILSGTYSLTTVAVITHSAAGQNSSFDAVLTLPAPGFAPVALAGLLVAAGGRLRRRIRD